MKYAIDKLRRIEWLHRLHAWYYCMIRRPFAEFVQCLWFCPIVRYRYRKQLACVQDKFGGKKIRVLFPISNLAKWKMQSLFEAMQQSAHYEPLMALTIMDIENALSIEGKRARIQQMRAHFAGKGMGCVDAYDFENGCAIPFDRFAPDIVFYQQPWRIADVQHPKSVSQYALTCYVPYFVQNYGALDMDCLLVFHRLLWRHYILNEDWAKEFVKAQGLLRAGTVVGVGHPMLDAFGNVGGARCVNECVIYAPHWSCHTGECFSTFLENGKEILMLAQRHPEIEWVFKPHPTLRKVLVGNGWMSEREVADYYDAWERIGTACYSGEYLELFERSKALITDCASFLVEYACTGKPIIHLISSDAKYKPHPISEALFSTYYQANDWDELERNFETVVLRGQDPQRDVRRGKVKEMRLCGNNAAKNIVDYLDGVLGGVDA